MSPMGIQHVETAQHVLVRAADTAPTATPGSQFSGPTLGSNYFFLT